MGMARQTHWGLQVSDTDERCRVLSSSSRDSKDLQVQDKIPGVEWS